MLRRLYSHISTAVAVLAVMAIALGAFAQNAEKRGRKYKAPPQTTKLEVTVIRDTDARPIENAAIVFHPMVDGKHEGNMELKSNEDGKAIIDVLPTGDMVRLQIIAKGFQTYGADYKIDKETMALEIRMKRPGEQYSIYKEHAVGERDQKSRQSKSNDKEDAEKPSDKPSESKPN